MSTHVMDSSEKEPLLINKNVEVVPVSKPSFSWSQYCFVNVIILLYSVAQVFEKRVLPLYIYGYFEKNYGDNGTSHSGVNISVTGFPNTSGTNCGSNASTNEDVAQSLSSTWIWYFKMAEYVGLFFTLIITGLLTDVIGRKPFLLLSLFGSCVRYLLKGYIIYENYDIVYLFIPYAVNGLTGSSSSFQVAILALIADSTPRGKSRSFYLAIYDLMIGIGDSASQIGAGYLVQDTGYVIPCLISSGICLLCAVLTIALLSESVQQTKKKYSVSTSFKNLIGFYHSSKYIKDNYSIWKFNLAMLIYMVYIFPLSSTLSTLYQLGSPFCWTPEDIGWFECASVMIVLVFGVAMMKILQYCFKDETIGALGCLSSVGEKVVYFYASSSWMLYVAPAVGILHIMPYPILRGIMSKMILEEQHGALFANMTVIEILLSMGSVSAFNNIYSETEEWKRGFVFLVMAGFYFLSTIMFIPLVCSQTKPRLQAEIIVQPDDNP